MEYTPQNLEYAVSVFYNGEQTDRAKAHAWLTAAQRVPEAWQFVWELLQPTKGTEVQFYAATTLHTKILRCWNEVPPESYEELKEKILQAVYTYSKGPKIVTNRLCISLAAFILQQGTLELASTLRPLSTPENMALLLEVLTVIPEEYNSMTMGSALRSKNRTALHQACPAVLDDMLRHLQTVYNDYSAGPPSEEIIHSWVCAATCACSWLALSEDADAGAAGILPDRMPLCQALLAVVRVLYNWNEVVSDSALDACEACLSAVRAAGSTHDSPRYPSAALQLIMDLTDLAAPIFERDNVPNSMNEELVCAVLTCCVAIGECHTRTIVAVMNGVGAGEVGAPGDAGKGQPGLAGHEGPRRLLELLLLAQAAPGHYPLHETRSNLIFGFWDTLQSEVLNDADKTQIMHPVWREVFARLLTALVCKSEAPAAITMSKDDMELLRCYRQDIADTVICCFMLVGEECWSLVEAAYSSSGTEARREAALHTFLALGDAAPHYRAPAGLLQLLRHAVNTVNTAATSPALNTALDCLGGYAAWLGSIQDGEGSALGRECILAAGAALPRHPAPAALALRKLCVDCNELAAVCVADIVHAAESSASALVGDTWTRRQLLGAAGAALAAAPQAASAPLLARLAHMLQHLLHQQAMEPARSTGAAEMAGALVSALYPQPKLAAELFRTILPTLPALADQPNLVEPMFHILKQTVSTLMSNSFPMLREIAQLTIAVFGNKPCATGLDVVQLIVLMFGEEWSQCAPLLQNTVSAASRAVAVSPAAAPDLAEGLFALLYAVTKKRPHYLDWIDELMPDLVVLGCRCCGSCEAGSGARRASCSWTGSLAARRPHALQPHAPALCNQILLCIAGTTPRNQMEPLAELLLALNCATWRAEDGGGGAGSAGSTGNVSPGLGLWMRQALAIPGFPTPHATDAHKQKFLNALIREKTSKRRILETVQEFSLVCRGLIDTEYARQTLASKQLVA